MELDPLAMAGWFNGEDGPEWYGYALQNLMRWTDREGLLFGGLVNAGEGYGEDAARYWAKVYNDSSGLEALGAGVMGGLASLWTPQTSDDTALTLLGGYAARVWGPVTPKGLPPWLARTRKYFRIDKPHHGKGWHIHCGN